MYYIVLKINKPSDSSLIKLSTLNLCKEIISDLQIIDFSKIEKHVDNNFKNNTYLFIKHIDTIKTKHLEKLKLDNYLIYEPIDLNFSNINYIDEYIKYFHKIIFTNKTIKNIYQSNQLILNKPIYDYIYHEYDNRFKIGNKQNQIFYLGDLNNKCSLNEDIIKQYNINHIKTCKNNNLHDLNITGIHINYLLPSNIYYNRITSTKLATALSTNSIFICNRVPIYEEILGTDYKFFFDDDLNNLQEIINNAINYLNNEHKYYKYLKKYNKEILSPDKISKKYYEILIFDRTSYNFTCT